MINQRAGLLLRLIALIAVLGVAIGGPGVVQAQGTNPLTDVAFEQKIDAQIPLDLPFVDSNGAAVTLGDYFGRDRPVILALGYYACPMLCSLVREGLITSLQDVRLNVGSDFDVVYVSIDPLETPMLAAGARAAAISRYGRPGTDDGWHFLTGGQDAIDQLAAAVGFRYVYDETINQYAHAAGIMVATPQGRVARYLFGIEYAANDIRFAVIEAADNKIGTAVDQLMLLCYQYDPVTGRYTGAVMNLIRLAGTITVVIMAVSIYLLSRGSGSGSGGGRPQGRVPTAV
jgi:protein SCO1/2